MKSRRRFKRKMYEVGFIETGRKKDRRTQITTSLYSSAKLLYDVEVDERTICVDVGPKVYFPYIHHKVFLSDTYGKTLFCSFHQEEDLFLFLKRNNIVQESI